MSQSYTSRRDKNLLKATGYGGSIGGFGERNSDSSTALTNQLSEQISSLNDRMDEFTNRLEEVNSKFTDFINENSSCQQSMVLQACTEKKKSMVLQAESCNGSALTSYFINPLGTGSLTGSKMPSSSSSSHLARESSLMDEISAIARGQRQIKHHIDNFNSLLRATLGETPQPHQESTNRKIIAAASESNPAHAMVVVAFGCLGIFLVKGLFYRT